MDSLFKKLFFLTVFLLTTTASDAQIRADVGINFEVGVPMAEFGDQLDDLGFGLGASGVFGLKGYPVLIGADVGLVIYGHERRWEPFSQTIPDVRVKVVTDNNIATAHLFLRLQPEFEVVRPYADAFMGLKQLFTDTRIVSDIFGETEIARTTNFNDTALSYGAGAGVQIRLSKIEENKGIDAVYLDIGTKYLIGAEAAYLEEGSIRRENGEVLFDVTRSKTTLLVPYLGVTMSF